MRKNRLRGPLPSLEYRTLLQAAAPETTAPETTAPETTAPEAETLATAEAPPIELGSFDIALDYQFSFTDAQKQAIDNAVGIWEMILIDGPETTPSLTIKVKEKTEGGAHADGNAFRKEMRFKSWISSTPGMTMLAVHEIGHVLGAYHTAGTTDFMNGQVLRWNLRSHQLTDLTIDQLTERGYTLNPQFSGKTVQELLDIYHGEYAETLAANQAAELTADATPLTMEAADTTELTTNATETVEPATEMAAAVPFTG